MTCCLLQPRKSNEPAVAPTDHSRVRASLSLALREPLWIATEQPVPPDIHEIAEHQKAVTQDMDLCGPVMRPTDGNFDRTQSVALGEKQDFGIETEALDALLFEHDTRRFQTESLEATLRVL